MCDGVCVCVLFFGNETIKASRLTVYKNNHQYTKA